MDPYTHDEPYTLKQLLEGPEEDGYTGITEQKVLRLLAIESIRENLRNEFDQQIRSIAYELAKIRGVSLQYYYDGFEIEGDEVKVTTSYRHCGGCGTDYDYISFPARYVWDWEKAKVEEQEEQGQKELAAAAQKKLDDEAKEAAALAARKQQYENLKKEFGT